MRRVPPPMRGRPVPSRPEYLRVCESISEFFVIIHTQTQEEGSVEKPVAHLAAASARSEFVAWLRIEEGQRAHLRKLTAGGEECDRARECVSSRLRLAARLREGACAYPHSCRCVPSKSRKPSALIWPAIVNPWLSIKRMHCRGFGARFRNGKKAACAVGGRSREHESKALGAAPPRGRSGTTHPPRFLPTPRRLARRLHRRVQGLRRVQREFFPPEPRVQGVCDDVASAALGVHQRGRRMPRRQRERQQ